MTILNVDWPGWLCEQNTAALHFLKNLKIQLVCVIIQQKFSLKPALQHAEDIPAKQAILILQ